mmetsp:Transcript_157486/g.277833  ORF Transcript_157486/g.277833 Transcript_157486/m.277833 type:complete len:250 (+) Transcript_157486:52-801(+)
MPIWQPSKSQFTGIVVCLATSTLADKHQHLSLSDEALLGQQQLGQQLLRREALIHDHGTAADDFVQSQNVIFAARGMTAKRPTVLTKSAYEPVVSCGVFDAAECAACPQGHGPMWCHGDCQWKADMGVCIEKEGAYIVPDPTPGPPKKKTSDSTATMSDDGAIRVPKEDPKAKEFRHEEAFREAEEEQDQKDKKKFWTVVLISFGASSGATLCAACVFCVLIHCGPKKKPGSAGLTEPVWEADAEANGS